MFISVEQIRAARALLGWTQKDLASRAGVNDDQIHNFEGGRSKSLSVLEAIYSALTNGGIDFIEGGAKYSKKELTTLTGKNWFYAVMDDVLKTLSGGSNQEVLFFGGSDAESPPELIEKIRALRAIGIKMRSMIRDGDTYMMGPNSEYRWIPKDLFSNYIVVIYGSKIVLDMGQRGVLIDNLDVSLVLKNMYELLWNGLMEPDCKSMADEKY